MTVITAPLPPTTADRPVCGRQQAGRPWRTIPVRR